MQSKKIYVVGDSHSEMLRAAAKTAGIDEITFRPFGATKQAVRPHHRVSEDRKTIHLLEENWREKILPISPSDLHTERVRYYVSLPYNVFPLLRRIDANVYTISTEDDGRAYLSMSAQDALFARRNRLSISLLEDMRSIGLNVSAIESPRPFEDAPLSANDNEMITELSNRYYEKTTELLRSAGIRVIRQPAVSINASGQTLRRFRKPTDNQHGTSDLYRLMLEAILQDAK